VWPSPLLFFFSGYYLFTILSLFSLSFLHISKVLVAAGVDMDARNGAGKTALHYCADSKARTGTGNLVRELIAMGADTCMSFICYNLFFILF